MENKENNKPNTKTSEFTEGNTKSYATSTPQTQRPEYNPPGQGETAPSSNNDKSSSSSQTNQGNDNKD